MTKRDEDQYNPMKAKELIENLTGAVLFGVLAGLYHCHLTNRYEGFEAGVWMTGLFVVTVVVHYFVVNIYHEIRLHSVKKKN